MKKSYDVTVLCSDYTRIKVRREYTKIKTEEKILKSFFWRCKNGMYIKVIAAFQVSNVMFSAFIKSDLSSTFPYPSFVSTRCITSITNIQDYGVLLILLIVLPYVINIYLSF